MFKKNIRNLIFKDFRISLHPSIYMFLILAPAMLFIPNYLRSIGFFYLVIGLMNIFTLDLQYKDKEFCGLLPVRKRECVFARIITISILELGMMLLTVPFAFLAHRYVFASGEIANEAGMNICATMYAIMLIGYAIVNVILVPAGYRKQFRAYLRGFVSMFVFMLVTIPLEMFVAHFRGGNWFLNGTSLSSIMLQLPVLAGALIFYILVNIYTYMISAKDFERAEI